MGAALTKFLTVALAAVLVVGAIAAASARDKKKPPVKRDAAQNLTRDEHGTPIIMQGLEWPKARAPEETAPSGRAERPRTIPRGSGTYIPPPVPSPSGGPPSPALLQPPPQAHKPPPIESFGDRVTKCIHSYPLNKGIGNNPTDQQMYIRQCAN